MKVLVLTCSYGEGHNSASIAIKEEFETRNIPVEMLDVSTFGNQKFAKARLNLFSKTAIKTPRLLNAIYKLGLIVSNDKVKSPLYINNALNGKKFKEYIEKNKFDVVISSHLFSMQTISYLINKGFKIKSYGIMTDYCYIPFIEETNLDKYIIPHKKLVKDFVKKGLKKDKLIPIGIPIKKTFDQEYSVAKAKEILNIKTKKPIVLVMMGGLGCGNALKISKNILKNNSVHVIVLAGKNKQLVKELKKKIKNNNFEVVSFTTKVNEYISAADIVISKPGGISSTEVVLKKKPLILFEAFLGVEEYNRHFFEKNKLAVYCRNIKDISKAIDNVFKNKYKFNNSFLNYSARKDLVDYVIKDSN